MEEILVVSHCILNPASKVISYNEEEIKEETSKRVKLLNYVLKHNIRIIQLPCPEFILYGAARWGHVKDQFNHPFFRKQCRVMLEQVILQLKDYMQYPDRFTISAIVAIDGSPSCGNDLTCRGEWGGEFSNCPDFESKINKLYMSNESGVFMEELKSLLEEAHLDIPIKDLGKIVYDLHL